MLKRSFITSSAFLYLLAVVAPAVAQEEPIDTQRFKPYATSGGFLQTEGTSVRYPIDPWSLGLWLSYAHNPLVALDDNGEVIETVVGTQLAFDLTASYAFVHWFELGLHAPLAYLGGDDVSEAAIGDLRLLPKFRLLDDGRDGVGLGFATELRLPTHTGNFYGGARNVVFAPRLLLDHLFGWTGFRLGLEFGALLREATHFRNVTAASELIAGLGMGFRFDKGRSPVEILLDMRSAVGLSEMDSEEVALEGLAAVGIDLSADWKVNVGGGLGLLEGFGVPTFRFLAGLRWEPSPNDPDHDGVRSPTASEQEAARQLEEGDGAEGAEGEGAEGEGAEGEGEAGGKDGEQEATAAGEGQGAEAVGDEERELAIREGYDACPDLPEDYDGIEDDDGCPEGDEDGDGVVDYFDACPDEEETINGFEDDDGCPDEGPAQIVVEEGRIVILETIRFRPNSAELEEESEPILNQIALMLRKHKEIKRVQIGGHTDSTGSRELNMRLSRNRAASVRRHLIGRGIKPHRMTAEGFGPDRPIADNETEEGRAKNRRVEFLTVD